MMGLRFSHGPLGFPGFGIPVISSSEYSPVSAVFVNRFAISWCNSSGPYFMYSAMMPSMPAL